MARRSVGSEIGLIAVQALAVNGAKVYVVGRTEEKLETVAARYRQGIAGQLIPLSGDVSDKNDIKRLVREVKSREKCRCILINNAGINPSSQKPEGEPAEDFRKNLFDPENANFEDWALTYKTNVAQLYFMTPAFLPLLEKATAHQYGYSGTVINITPISGSVLKSQSHFPYNVSKAAAN